MTSTGGGSNRAWGLLYGNISENNYGPAIDSVDSDIMVSWHKGPNGGSEPLIQEADPHITKLAIEARI